MAYRERNLVERLINRLKQNRAIATRYDKLAVSYHAMLTFACILIWLQACRHALGQAVEYALGGEDGQP